jgi:EAL domain-containing protein (putative c-di-GMP-specific phosphodiesterase class I)
MQKHSARNLELSNAMFRALEKDEFEVYYQPQISNDSGEIIGAEALLRWNNSELGMISPVEFIPIAENNGLILPIGEWVIKSVIKQAKIWMEAGLKPIIIAINISAVQFRHVSLPDTISNALKLEGLPPEYIEIELTESVAMKNPKKAIETMDVLHGKGIRMSIDDFGTGYSSLSYLKKFKIYKLKIDQSFVRDINTDEEDKKIVGAIINMSKNLGLKTIAEGVETIGQLEFLKEQGCDEIQGYYYAKPMPAEDFEAFRDGFKI